MLKERSTSMPRPIGLTAICVLSLKETNTSCGVNTIVSMTLVSILTLMKTIEAIFWL